MGTTAWIYWLSKTSPFLASSQLNWGFFILMKILRLTLKKRWFDMIKDGVKLEEYREVKPYWADRLLYRIQLPKSTGGYWNAANDILKGDHEAKAWKAFTGGAPVFQKYDAVEFINGYHPTSPRLLVKCNSITISQGNPEWGAEAGVKYFVIHLGEQLKASAQKGVNNG